MATKKTTKKKTTKKKTAAKKTAKKQTPKTTQAWNNVKGLMRIWAAERKHKKKTWLSFSTSIGKKNEDEVYDNVYFDVLFKKNEAPGVDEGAFEINVKKGFLTLTVYSDGSIHPAVMVMEYDLKDADEDDDEYDDEYDEDDDEYDDEYDEDDDEDDDLPF